MRRINRFVLALTALLLAALACNMPQNQPPATSDPSLAFTAAAQTVAAQLTQSALLLSTATTLPSLPTIVTVTSVPTLTSPAPTIQPPTVPLTATQDCDKAQFVTDVTYPDNSILAPGEVFTKTWRIKNIGTCSWTPSYTVAYSSGEQMSGPSVQALTGNVNPGQSVDISVNLKAPSVNGSYTGYWKLRNASGVTFTQFYVQIKVQGGGGSGPFAVTSITYTLSTWSDVGHLNCPRIIAHITANGTGTVNFKWTRADSPGGGTLQAVTFAVAGTESVNYDWARGSVWAGSPTWVGIYIADPNNQDFGHKNFNTACTSP